MKKQRSQSKQPAADGQTESPAALPTVGSEAASKGLPIIYKRNRWQHFVRFVAFGGIMALDFGLVGSAISHHLVRTYSMLSLGRELLAYFLVLLCNLVVVPSIVLEAHTVEVTDDRLILNNLLFATSLPWEDIKSVVAPVYLKFAIIKTRKFFYLLNKRDIDGFSDLINTIRQKMGTSAN